MICYAVLIQYQNVTDRQTDRQTDRIAISISRCSRQVLFYGNINGVAT